MSGSEAVLITGVSGYVGSWCCQKALEAGFQVIGSARDPQSPECGFLQDAMQSKSSKLSSKAAFNLKLVKADLHSSHEVWDQIFKDNPSIKYVLHTASPPTATEPKAAFEGMMSVLKAAITNSVRRVVLTSSQSAVLDPITHGKVYTAADWSDPDNQDRYSKVKTLVEKAAWNIMKESSTELCTVIPLTIMGPTLYKDDSLLDANDTCAFAKRMVMGQVGALPNTTAGIVDVRDVAKVHLKAMTMPDAPGKRFICCSETLWMKDVQAKFAKAAGVAEAGIMPCCIFCCLAPCVPEARMIDNKLDKSFRVDTTETRNVLELNFVPIQHTVLAMVDDFVALGVITKSDDDDVQQED